MAERRSLREVASDTYRELSELVVPWDERSGYTGTGYWGGVGFKSFDSLFADDWSTANDKISSNYDAYKKIALVKNCIKLLSHFTTRNGFNTEVTGPVEATRVKIKNEIDRINRQVNMDGIIYQSVIVREIWGRSAYQIVRGKGSKLPLALLPLNPMRIRPIRNPKTGLLSHYVYKVQGKKDTMQIKPERILYFPLDSLDVSELGESSISTLRMAIRRKNELAIDMLQAAKRCWAPFGIFQLNTTKGKAAAQIESFKNEIKPGMSIVTNLNVDGKVYDMKPDLNGLVRAEEKVDEEIMGNWQMPKALLSREKCVVGDTIIFDDEKGLVKVKDYNKGELFCLDEETYGIRKTKQFEVFPAGDKDCVQITTGSGWSLGVSTDHPFLTQRGWICAEDLVPKDDYIITPHKLQFTERYQVPEEVATLAGMWFSEGCWTWGKGPDGKLRERISINNKDLNFINELQRCLDEVGIVYSRTDNPIPTIQINGTSARELIDVFKSVGLTVDDKGALHKKITGVFNWNEEAKIAFLKWFWEGDGSTSRFKYKKSLQLKFCTNSEELAMGIRVLLASVGFASQSVKQKHNKFSNSNEYFVQIGGEYAIKLADLIGVAIDEEYRSTNHRTNDVDMIPMSKSELRQYGIYNQQSRVKKSLIGNDKRASDDIWWDRVKVVEQIGRKPVWDLTVEDHHTFFAGGVLVSNTMTKSTLEFSLHALYAGPVAGVQLYYRRQIERQWYDMIVKTMGYDPLLYRVKHIWTPMVLADANLIRALAYAVEKKVMTKLEMFTILGWKLGNDEPDKTPDEPGTDEAIVDP